MWLCQDPYACVLRPCKKERFKNTLPNHTLPFSCTQTPMHDLRRPARPSGEPRHMRHALRSFRIASPPSVQAWAEARALSSPASRALPHSLATHVAPHTRRNVRALCERPQFAHFFMHGRGTCLALAAAQFRPQIRTLRPTPEATPRSALSHVPSAFDEELRPRTLCVDVNSLILVNARCRDVISRQRTVRRRNFSSMHCAGT